MKIIKDETATQITHRRHVKIEDGPIIEPKYFFTAGSRLKVEHVSIIWDEGQTIGPGHVKVSGHRILKNGNEGKDWYTVNLYASEGFPDWLKEIVDGVDT